MTWLNSLSASYSRSLTDTAHQEHTYKLSIALLFVAFGIDACGLLPNQFKIIKPQKMTLSSYSKQGERDDETIAHHCPV